MSAADDRAACERYAIMLDEDADFADSGTNDGRVRMSSFEARTNARLLRASVKAIDDVEAWATAKQDADAETLAALKQRDEAVRLWKEAIGDVAHMCGYLSDSSQRERAARVEAIVKEACSLLAKIEQGREEGK